MNSDFLYTRTVIYDGFFFIHLSILATNSVSHLSFSWNEEIKKPSQHRRASSVSSDMSSISLQSYSSSTGWIYILLIASINLYMQVYVQIFSSMLSKMSLIASRLILHIILYLVVFTFLAPSKRLNSWSFDEKVFVQSLYKVSLWSHSMWSNIGSLHH